MVRYRVLRPFSNTYRDRDAVIEQYHHGPALTVTVAVSGGNSNPTPTGSVALTGGGYTSAATTLSSGSATINVPANSLGAGTRQPCGHLHSGLLQLLDL